VFPAAGNPPPCISWPSEEGKRGVGGGDCLVVCVMNITCIYLRAKDLNIYMYRRGRIYKEPPWRNTIIEKANTYLIV
jgi:hypothetical protein